jgi:hypothetical protein
MPRRATRLFQLRDVCVGGAVLMYRRAGSVVRGSAERAIKRGAARNMMERGKAGTRRKGNGSWRTSLMLLLLSVTYKFKVH